MCVWRSGRVVVEIRLVARELEFIRDSAGEPNSDDDDGGGGCDGVNDGDDDDDDAS